MEGICRLYDSRAELQESHIIPAFVFRWRKDTSPTPHMRSSTQPQRRVQDGIKHRWLCRGCEQTLGDWETQFASDMFHPITSKGCHRISYSKWLLKFCVSISWRALLSAKEETSYDEFTEEQRRAAESALHVWREFMLGRAPHPGPHEQHLLIFEDASYEGGALPANMNRYALRSIERDVASSDAFQFTFIKMGPFAVLGFFDVKKPNLWRGGKVHVNRGEVGPTKYVLPRPFFDYLVGRANKYGAILDKLSDRQREVADKATDAAIAKNVEKLSDSHWMKAMRLDYDQFGKEALTAGFPPKKSGR